MNVTLYQQRKESGLCTRCGTQAVDGAQLCAPHLKNARQRTKLAMDKRRVARAKAGCCVDCGRRAEKGATKLAPRCKACRIAAGRFKRTVVNKSVNSRTADLAAATRISTLGGEEGRTRYYGKQKRGAPALAVTNADAGREITKQVATAVLADQLADSPDVAALPRLQRIETRDAAGGVWLLAARMIRDHLVRRRIDVSAVFLPPAASSD